MLFFRGKKKKETYRVRKRKISWTVEDGRFWAGVLGSPTWKKIEAIAEDMSIEDVLPESGILPANAEVAVAKGMARRAMILALRSLAPSPEKGRDIQEDEEEETDIQFIED